MKMQTIYENSFQVQPAQENPTSKHVFDNKDSCVSNVGSLGNQSEALPNEYPIKLELF